MQVLQKYLKNYAYRGSGLLLVLISLFLLISFSSYDRADPSWNTAVEGTVQNLGGYKGAIWADLLRQFYGYGAIVFVLTMGLLGGQLLFLKVPRFLKLKLFFLPWAQWILSTFMVSTGFWKTGGGSVGLLTFSALEKIRLSLFFHFPEIALSLILFISSIFSFGFILSVKFYHFLKAFQFLQGQFSFFKRYVEVRQQTPPLSKAASRIFENLNRYFTRLKSKKSSNFDRNLEPTLSSEPRKMPVFEKNEIDNITIDQKNTFEENLDFVSSNQPFVSSFEEMKPEESRPVSIEFSSILKTLTPQVPLSPAPMPEPKIQQILTPKMISSKSQELDLESTYQLPSLDLLITVPPQDPESLVNETHLLENARHLMSVLEDFGIRGEVTKVHPGPVVTLYELLPAPGIKASRVIGLADDIARSMSALSTRIAVIPGHNAIGIELPNKIRQTVYLQELLTSQDYEALGPKLPLALGKDIGGNPVIADLARMPHLLVAGTTGAGKSVAINTMILSLLYQLSPERCRFIMIDPKMLELSVYDGIPHLLSPVVTEPKKAVFALKWTVKEMEDRYRAMSKLGVRNIEGYNLRLAQARIAGEVLTRQVQTGFDTETGQPVFESQPLSMTPFPYIVVVVDEMADLMLVAGKDIEATVQRLAQMARAAGIHLIMATQRPSVDVITGTIKANFPTRISFQVTSRFDSRTILSEQGAEQLLGRGDMLYMEAGGKIQRVHGPFVSDQEVERVVNFLKSQAEPDYMESITEEDTEVPLGISNGSDDKEEGLYQQAVQLIRREQKASTSFVQRHLRIGYNSAARIIEKMESEGIISAPNHKGKRDVLS